MRQVAQVHHVQESHEEELTEVQEVGAKVKNSRRTERAKVKKAKRDPVVMPLEPPYEIIRWLAGSPLILAASDEQRIRMQYAEFRERMKDARK